MGNIGKTIAAPGALTLRYSEAMLKDVRADQFARLATPGGKPVQSNHPCWVFGHCGLYWPRVLEICGKPAGSIVNPAGWDALFKNGTECKDDPSGTVYPPMERVTKHYFDGLKAALAAASEAEDSVLMEANPAEGRMKEMFPTRGGMAAFLLAAHPMSHMGQVSAWRRMMGLGSAM